MLKFRPFVESGKEIFDNRIVTVVRRHTRKFQIWDFRFEIWRVASDRKKETHTRQVLNCASAIRKARVRSMRFPYGWIGIRVEFWLWRRISAPTLRSEIWDLRWRSICCSWVNFMVKLLRAHGGCLGTSRRWRTWQAAISCGEEQASFDPQISEWGNPHEHYSCITIWIK